MSGIDFVWPEQEEFCYSSDTEVKEFTGKTVVAQSFLKPGYFYYRDPYTGLQIIVCDDDFEPDTTMWGGRRLKINPIHKGLWVRDPIPPRTQAYPSSIPSVLAKQVAPPEQLYRAEDFDYSEILVGTYQEAEQAFLERHPEFDRDSVKHFIFQL